MYAKKEYQLKQRLCFQVMHPNGKILKGTPYQENLDKFIQKNIFTLLLSLCICKVSCDICPLDTASCSLISSILELKPHSGSHFETVLEDPTSQMFRGSPRAFWATCDILHYKSSWQFIRSSYIRFYLMVNPLINGNLIEFISELCSKYNQICYRLFKHFKLFSSYGLK